jgi:hypothetical protein
MKSHFLSSASITLNAISTALGMGVSPDSYRMIVRRFFPSCFASSSWVNPRRSRFLRKVSLSVGEIVTKR